MDPQLHEQVNIAKLLFAGGLADTVAKAHAAIVHGNVYIEHWNINVTESTLPRWVLRGATLTIGERSIRVAEDGLSLRRLREGALW